MNWMNYSHCVYLCRVCPSQRHTNEMYLRVCMLASLDPLVVPQPPGDKRTLFVGTRHDNYTIPTIRRERHNLALSLKLTKKAFVEFQTEVLMLTSLAPYSLGHTGSPAEIPRFPVVTDGTLSLPLT